MSNLATQQMEHEVAAAVALEAAQEAAKAATAEAKLRAETKAESSGAAHDSPAEHAESTQLSAEQQAFERQGQLLTDVRGFMKIARNGVKQRQTALQIARSTWQVSRYRSLIISAF